MKSSAEILAPIFFVMDLLLLLSLDNIFNIPGIGRFYVEAAQNRDYTMIMGTTILFSAMIIFFNLLYDLSELIKNPKARSEL